MELALCVAARFSVVFWAWGIDFVSDCVGFVIEVIELVRKVCLRPLLVELSAAIVSSSCAGIQHRVVSNGVCDGL